MLKFFRKIRHQLLSENQISKYLLYAAGEILLVMIGILLALQVNNWNQKQLEHSTIKESLSEIAENLAADNSQLKALLQLRTEDYRAQKKLSKPLKMMLRLIALFSRTLVGLSYLESSIPLEMVMMF